MALAIRRRLQEAKRLTAEEKQDRDSAAVSARLQLAQRLFGSGTHSAVFILKGGLQRLHGALIRNSAQRLGGGATLWAGAIVQGGQQQIE